MTRTKHPTDKRQRRLISAKKKKLSVEGDNGESKLRKRKLQEQIKEQESEHELREFVKDSGGEYLLV